MKILVFSDSHGHIQPMIDAIFQFSPDAVFHLGDLAGDGNKLHARCPDLPFYQVSGNCDSVYCDYPPENVARMCGKTIFFCHGHTLSVKLSLSEARSRAASLGADVLLFGHTHRPFLENTGRYILLNPGAARDSCFALLELEPEAPVRAQLLAL